MHQIIFVGAEDSVADMEPDENPANEFPCMSSQVFHREARAQMYALASGEFLDAALGFEMLDQTLGQDGPYIYRLDPGVQRTLAYLEEDGIESLASAWMLCEEIESLDLTENDLHDFIFQFVHFCQTATNDDLGLYLYSDD